MDAIYEQLVYQNLGLKIIVEASKEARIRGGNEMHAKLLNL